MAALTARRITMLSTYALMPPGAPGVYVLTLTNAQRTSSKEATYRSLTRKLFKKTSLVTDKVDLCYPGVLLLQNDFSRTAIQNQTKAISTMSVLKKRVLRRKLTW